MRGVAQTMSKLASESGSPWNARAVLVSLLLLVGLWLAGVARYRFADLVVSWDSKTQFYPFHRFVAAWLADGVWPAWNPFQYGGYPGIADPQSLLFQPGFLLYGLIDPTPSLQGFDAFVSLYLLVGGMALIGFGYRRDWHPLAALLGAVVLMFGGSMASRLSHTGMIVTIGLFPLALLLLDILVKRASIAAGLAFAAVGAMLAIGRDQVGFLCALFLIGYALTGLIDARRRGEAIAGRLAVIAVSGLLIALMLAVPVILTLQMAQVSNRPAFDFNQAAVGSLYPVNLITLIAPNAFGSLTGFGGYYGPDVITRPMVDTTDRLVNYLFLGTAPIVLLVWHGLVGGRLWVPGQRALTAGLALALVYAVGRYGGLFYLLFEYMPGVAQYRRPADATFLFTALAAFGVAALASRYIRLGNPNVNPLVAVAAVVAVLALALWAVQFATIRGKAEFAAREIALAFVLVGAMVAALALAPLRRHRVLVAAVLLAATSLELIAINLANSTNAEARSVYAVLEAPEGEAAQALKAIEADIASRRAFGERPRVEILGLGGAWQNLAMVRGLEAINGYNPLRLMDYELLVEAGQNAHDTTIRSFPRSFGGYGSDLAKLIGLDYVVTDRPLADFPQGAPVPKTTALFDGAAIKVYRLDQALPRVALATNATPYDRARVIDERSLPGPLVAGNVWIEEGTKLAGTYRQLPPPAEATARITDYTPTEVQISIDTPSPAILVLRDLWYPGWEAEIDGRPAPVLRADVLFRGVEVPAGKHEIRFVYRPLTRANLSAAIAAIRKPWPTPPVLDSLLKPPQGWPSKN